jgi:predicted Ser/Thr protein kinase
MDSEKRPPIIDIHALPPLPEMIGPYKIKSLFKIGGMSLLYLGVHPKTSEPVIVKVLLPQFLKDKEVLQRLVREARIIGLADHPNIVKFYDLGLWENGIYVAMEFIEGLSLRHFIKQENLIHRRALEIILQVAYALAHLHGQGIIHRDIKPDNIIVTESGDIKLVDYGISQFANEDKRDQVTKRVVRIGTPRYMSPEQMERAKISFNSDIYSLAIVAYELYLGRLSQGVIQFAFLPLGLRKIIEKALQLDPKSRYQDILEFIADLTHYLKTLDQTTKEEEFPDEFSMVIESARSLLVSKKIPRWPEIEIGIAIREGLMYHPLYLDFLSLSQTQHCIVFAEPFTGGANALSQCALLRGIVRTAKLQAKNARQLLDTVNHVLQEDLLSQKFNISVLVLEVDKNTLSFISCGDPHHSFLWHFRDVSQEPHILEVENPPLNTDLQPDFLEIEENWRPGETLVFSSFKPQADMKKHLPLSCQPLAETALKSIPTAGLKRTGAFLALRLV